MHKCRSSEKRQEYDECQEQEHSYKDHGSKEHSYRKQIEKECSESESENECGESENFHDKKYYFNKLVINQICSEKYIGPQGPTGSMGLQGLTGPRGIQGPTGLSGATGSIGATGSLGPTGPIGLQGLIGPTGPQGLQGLIGSTGPTGIQGLIGSTGSTGLQGATGSIISLGISDFYAIMPPDNASSVAIGGAVNFPNDGPTDGVITRIGPSTFNLPTIGIYQVYFQVSVAEAGQLGIFINTNIVPYSISGRATGTSQITNKCLISTTSVNSILSIINPTSKTTALTISPLAGGASPVSAHLIIQKIT